MSMTRKHSWIICKSFWSRSSSNSNLFVFQQLASNWRCECNMEKKIHTCNRPPMPTEYSAPVCRMHAAFQWWHRHWKSSENAQSYRPLHAQCAQSCCCVRDPFAEEFSPKTCADSPKSRRRWKRRPVADWTFVCDRKIHSVVRWMRRSNITLLLPFGPIRWQRDCCPHAVQLRCRTHNTNDARPNDKNDGFYAVVPMWAIHPIWVTISDLDFTTHTQHTTMY